MIACVVIYFKIKKLKQGFLSLFEPSPSLENLC